MTSLNYDDSIEIISYDDDVTTAEDCVSTRSASAIMAADRLQDGTVLPSSASLLSASASAVVVDADCACHCNLHHVGHRHQATATAFVSFSTCSADCCSYDYFDQPRLLRHHKTGNVGGSSGGNAPRRTGDVPSSVAIGGTSGVSAAVTGGIKSSKSIPPEILSPQFRRMRCAIVVMAVVMIAASMLLVGVSLSMAEHIDGLANSVQKMNRFGMTSSTPAPSVVDVSERNETNAR